MYRKTFLVYPTTLKQQTTVENFISDSEFTSFRGIIVTSLSAIGVSDSDTSRYVEALSHDNYYMKFTINFDSEEQHESWVTEFDSGLDSRNIDDMPFIPFFEEVVDDHLI